jgi:DNA polymerase I
MRGLEDFTEVVVVDFEFQQPDGERPVPVCVVAHELVSGRRHRRMLTSDVPEQPPYPVDDRTLVVAYYAPAEMGCHLALSWTPPVHVLDLYAEFRNLTNGMEMKGGRSLLDALVYHGLDSIEAVEKERMRQLAMRGAPYTLEEEYELLDYCELDVTATAKLLKAMLPSLDVLRAVLRGRYMKAVARMERTGVPIDTNSLAVLQERWESIQEHMVRRVDAAYGVYEGRTFKQDRFAQYLAGQNLWWPQLESGRLALDDDTFRQMARLFPQLEPLRQLRVMLSQMRLSELAVGHDCRNRCMLSPLAAKTGRNQPSNTRFIFGPSAWMRGLIKPEAGRGLCYVDWSQQEFGVAAALSGDSAMQAAYLSGDPYLAFAKQAGAAPMDATKASHRAVRDQFKECVLAVQYQMGAESLAARTGQPVYRAMELLRLHRATYPVYWRWSESAQDFAQLHRELPSVFGWTLHVTATTKSRTTANFPMQANGAEMLRLACCLVTERGVEVCAPVHDALLIEAPLTKLDEQVRLTQSAMEEASMVVLDGFRLRSDAKMVVAPDRYEDEKGAAMWKLVWEVVGEMEAAAI